VWMFLSASFLAFLENKTEDRTTRLSLISRRNKHDNDFNALGIRVLLYFCLMPMIITYRLSFENNKPDPETSLPRSISQLKVITHYFLKVYSRTYIFKVFNTS
jgi:hypothetical protein